MAATCAALFVDRAVDVHARPGCARMECFICMDNDVDDALLSAICKCNTCVHAKCLERLVCESNRTTCGVCRTEYNVVASRVHTRELTDEGMSYLCVMGTLATVSYPLYLTIDQYNTDRDAVVMVIMVIFGAWTASMLCQLLIATHMLFVGRWSILVIESKVVSVSTNV